MSWTNCALASADLRLVLEVDHALDRQATAEIDAASASSALSARLMRIVAVVTASYVCGRWLEIVGTMIPSLQTRACAAAPSCEGSVSALTPPPSTAYPASR